MHQGDALVWQKNGRFGVSGSIAGPARRPPNDPADATPRSEGPLGETDRNCPRHGLVFCSGHPFWNCTKGIQNKATIVGVSAILRQSLLVSPIAGDFPSCFRSVSKCPKYSKCPKCPSVLKCSQVFPVTQVSKCSQVSVFPSSKCFKPPPFQSQKGLAITPPRVSFWPMRSHGKTLSDPFTIRSPGLFLGDWPKARPSGHGSKSRTPSEHPNPTTKIPTKMGGEFTHPKMVPLVFPTKMAVAQKTGTENGTLVSGSMDQNPRNPSCLILSHTQIGSKMGGGSRNGFDNHSHLARGFRNRSETGRPGGWQLLLRGQAVGQEDHRGHGLEIGGGRGGHGNRVRGGG